MAKNKLPWALVRGIVAKSTEKRYMNIKDAALYLDVAPATLRNWERLGKIKVKRHALNDYRQYLKEDLDALMISREDPEKVRKRREYYKRKKETREEFLSEISSKVASKEIIPNQVKEIIPNQVEENDNQIFNLRQAAEFFGVKIIHLKDWIKEKNINIFINPDNNQQMFFKRDLEKLMKQELEANKK